MAADRADNGRENARAMIPPPRLIVGAGRGACVIAALGGLLAGVGAVFKSDNELGTLGLLGIGALAGVTALTGRIPRVKLGGHELDPYERAVAVAEGAEAVSDAAFVLASDAPDPDALATSLDRYVVDHIWPAALLRDDNLLRLRHEEHMSLGDIASQTGVSRERVRQRLQQAEERRKRSPGPPAAPDGDAD